MQYPKKKKSRFSAVFQLQSSFKIGDCVLIWLILKKLVSRSFRSIQVGKLISLSASFFTWKLCKVAEQTTIWSRDPSCEIFGHFRWIFSIRRCWLFWTSKASHSSTIKNRTLSSFNFPVLIKSSIRPGVPVTVLRIFIYDFSRVGK